MSKITKSKIVGILIVASLALTTLDLNFRSF